MPPGIPGVPNKRTPKSFLQDGESLQYTADAVVEANDDAATIARSKSYLSGGGTIDRDEAERRVALETVGYKVQPSTGDAYLPLQQPSRDRPANPSEVRRHIAMNYPAVTAAALKSGLSERQVLRHVNFALAVDAARSMTNTVNPQRQAQIINTMGPDMQGMVVQILETWAAEAAKDNEVVEENPTGSALLDAGAKVWNYTGGPLFDGLWQATEVAMRATNAGAIQLGALAQGKFIPVDDLWEGVGPQQYSPQGLEYARQQYGPRVVDIILELRKAGAQEDSDQAIGEVIRKYSDAEDIEALAVIDAALFGINTDQSVQDAVTYIASQELGNLGNTVFWSAMSTAGVPRTSTAGNALVQSPLYTGIRDATNVASIFTMDPTSIVGGVAKGYRSARYGLRLLDAGSIDKAFNKRAVRTFFDTFGAALTKADEAVDQALAAQTLNSIRSQYKRYFDADAIETMFKAGVRDADTARDFFTSADNLGVMLSGQTARRGSQVVIPHMITATARFKRASLAARGFTYDRNAGKQIDAIFGEGVSKMVPEEAVPLIIQQLSATDGDKFVGRMLSDFVFANDTAKTTFLGKLFRAAAGANPRNEGLRILAQRYGYARQGGLRATGERIARNMAHVPDISDGLWVVDGRDAGKVRDLMLYAGMPKYWADYSADLWRNMTEGQRIRFASGMGRSTGFALGVDITDPVYGTQLIDNLNMGLRKGELYAPDQQDLVALRARADVEGLRAVEEKFGAAAYEMRPTKKGNLVPVMTDEAKALKKEVSDRAFDAERGNLPLFNPSRSIDTMQDATNGLYRAQFTDRIAFPNLDVLDRLSMRQSYLTALLGTNGPMTTLVDYWTLGTLAGPRFAIRNGIEDAVFFGITGGNWRGYRYGQLYSRAKRESMQRPLKTRKLKDGTFVTDLSSPPKGQKLGLAVEGSRRVGDVVDNWLGDQMPKALRGIILPHLSPEEIVAANAAGKAGDRKVLSELIMKALLRQKLIFLKRPKNKQVLADLDDASQHPAFFNVMDDASESAAELASGAPVGGVAGEEVLINGEPMRIVKVGGTYFTGQVRKGAIDPEGLAAWWNGLSVAIHGDGGKGFKAVSLIRKYYNAKRSPNPKKAQAIVSEFAEWIDEYAGWVRERSGLAATEGLESFARRNLDDVLRMFTTKGGRFNQELFDKVRRVDVDPVTGEKLVTYALWDETVEGIKYRVSQADLAEIKGRPQSILGYDGVKVPVSTRLPLNQRMWNAMGRSLARLTREPIFVANYLDARDLLRPIEKRLADELSEDAARAWATNAATERAFATTMAYVDNPMVRSQLAWNLRNVARFYRAQEDFFRRMIRVSKDNPLAFQKLNLAWHALDDSGFTYENEYGDKYFIWPGSRAAIDTLSTIVRNVYGFELSNAGMPASFVSDVTMLTPSADPNAIFPTFSSIYASAGIKPLMRVVPGLASFEEELFGPYSPGTPVWESILPVNVMRPLEYLAYEMIGQDTRGGATTGKYANYAKTALQAAAAAGLFDESKMMDPKAVRDMKSYVDIIAMDLLRLNVALGPSLPAAYQLAPDTVTDFGRSIGVDGMRESFVQVLKAYDGDINQAYLAWLPNNPGKSIFTISGNKNGEWIGNYGPFTETVAFIESNKDMVDRFPVGAAFFAPQEGTQNLAAWNYLRAMGAKFPKSVDQYFNEMATSQGYALYRVYKKQYDDAVAAGRKDEVQPKWDAARADLFARYPMLQSRLAGQLSVSDFNSKIDYGVAVEDVRGAVNWMAEQGKLDARGEWAQQVLALYDEARASLGQFSPNDPAYRDNRERIRDQWKAMYAQMKPLFPDDAQWESLLYSTSGSLGFEVE